LQQQFGLDRPRNVVQLPHELLDFCPAQFLVAVLVEKPEDLLDLEAREVVVQLLHQVEERFLREL